MTHSEMPRRPQSDSLAAVWRRRQFASSSCALALLVLVAAAPRAHGQFTHTTNAGTITITGYTGPSGPVTVPDTINGWPVTAIGPRAFRSRTSLTRITLPDSVTSIGTNAFEFCTGLTNAALGNGLLTLGNSGFRRCTRLADVVLGNRTETIGISAFEECSQLGAITIPDSVVALGSNAFSSCSSLSSVTLGAGLRNIGDRTFEHCRRLGSIALPAGITNIGRESFLFCTTLTNLDLGIGLRSIDAFAFQFCVGLTNVSFPDGLLRLRERAFIQCNGLTRVLLPASVTNVGSAPFQSCSNLVEIDVDPLNPAYKSVDGVLFNRAGSWLVQCHGARAGVFTVPGTVRVIGDYAFCDCTRLTGIVLEEGVSSVRRGAFAFCFAVASASLPQSLAVIDDLAFEECAGLRTLTIPPHVGWLGDGAFYYCQNLESVFFQAPPPSHVGANAFAVVNRATAYYLPGVWGWPDTFAGLPTSLWNPCIITADPGFGVRTNRFGFSIGGTAGNPFVLEAATDLAAKDWLPLETNRLGSQPMPFVDPRPIASPGQFYRLRSP